MTTDKSSTTSLPLHGSCFCGSIQLTLTASPQMSYICHCTNCRRQTGSSFNHMSIFSQSAVSITDPKSALRTFGEEDDTHRKFCSLCGTRLLIYFKPSIETMKGKLSVPVGVIEDSWQDRRFKPTHEGYCARREEWMPDMEGTILLEVSCDLFSD